MFKAYDIALSPRSRAVAGTNRKGKVVSKSSSTDLSIGGLFSEHEALEGLLRSLYAELVPFPKLGLMPPRVLVSSVVNSVHARAAIKEACIHAGAREVLLLDRGMAVALDHYGDAMEKSKALVVCYQSGMLEIAGYGGLLATQQWTWHAEQSITIRREAGKSHTQALANYPVSVSALESFEQTLGGLVQDGYGKDDLLLWSVDTVPEAIMEVLTKVHTNLNLVDPDADLAGCRLVMADLKWFLSDKPKS